MLELKIGNFRSFKDPEPIEIHPITILVGKNGSGKSTITRIFPLLRQSSEVRSNAPVLWFGDYVDFGSFSDIEPKFPHDRETEISFGLDVADIPTKRPSVYQSSLHHGKRVKYSAFLHQDADRTALSRFVFCIDDDVVGQLSP